MKALHPRKFSTACTRKNLFLFQGCFDDEIMCSNDAAKSSFNRSIKKRAKSVYSQRNLGTIKEQKKENKKLRASRLSFASCEWGLPFFLF